MPDVVSVIVPVHDLQDHLDDCLRSVSGQTHRDLEVIVVDDGSTDASPRLCDAWADEDERITVVHTPNEGASAARNRGLAIASGDYVMFVDGDDVIAPTLVADTLAMLRSSDADIAMTGFVGFESRTPSFPTAVGPTRTEPAHQALRRIVCQRPQWEVWAKLFRRSVWDGVSFPPGLVHQDLHVTPRVFRQANTVVSCEAPLYGYRTRAGSTMDRTREVSLSSDLLTILTANIELARQDSASVEEYQEYLGAYLLQASKQLERLGAREAWVRNATFRRDYRAFSRTYRWEMAACAHISRVYRVLFVVSSVSPRAFRNSVRLGGWLKSHGVAGIRRVPGHRVTS